MPTATTAGMLSLNNLGALTTTFSMPSSCATYPGFTATGIANPDLDSNMVLAVDTCDDDRYEVPEECLPHGDKISEQWESVGRRVETILNYYSPGLHCPNDWATVGVYTAGQESNDATATDGDLGIFSPTAFNYGRPGESSSFPYADFKANMFTSALGPSETAVVCCPSGFSIDPYGACYSNIPISELAGKSGCYRQATGAYSEPPDEWETITWGFWGDSTTVTQRPYEIATATEPLSTVTVTFDDDGIPETGAPAPGRLRGGYDDDELKGILVKSPLYLVRGAEDGDGSGANGGEGDDEDDDEDGDGDEGSSDEDSDEDNDDNTAGHLLPTNSVLAALGFSFAAGLGLLIAW